MAIAKGSLDNSRRGNPTYINQPNMANAQQQLVFQPAKTH